MDVSAAIAPRQADGKTGTAAQHVRNPFSARPDSRPVEVQGPLDASPNGEPVGQAETVAKQERRLAVVPAVRAVVPPHETDVVAKVVQPLGQSAKRQVVRACHGLGITEGVPDHDLGLAAAAGYR